jgi:hypothetical protein
MRFSIDITTLTEQHVVHGTSSTLYASPGETQRHDETWIVASGGGHAGRRARDPHRRAFTHAAGRARAARRSIAM